MMPGWPKGTGTYLVKKEITAFLEGVASRSPGEESMTVVEYPLPPAEGSSGLIKSISHGK